MHCNTRLQEAPELRDERELGTVERERAERGCACRRCRALEHNCEKLAECIYSLWVFIRRWRYLVIRVVAIAVHARAVVSLCTACAAATRR